MSTVTPLIDPVDDLWPRDGGPPDGDLLDAARARLAPARREPRGVELRRRQHVGQGHGDRPRRPRGAGDVGQGLGLGPRHDGPRSTSPGLRLDEVLPLIERDAMSDEEMVAYLARCQLDPAMPRCSIETLLHAFVPAPHVHHTHPDGINVLAGHGRRRAARARVLRRRGGVDPLHPPRLHALQAGRRGRARPTRTSSSWCSPSTGSWSGATRAEEAYRRTIEVDQPGGRVRQRAHGRPAALRRPARRGRPAATPERRARCCAELLPAIRGAVSSERPKLLDADTSPRALEFVASAQAERLVTVGAPCPDHLVHTKRVPLWIPFDPDADDADALRARIARAGGGVPRRLPRLRRGATATTTTEPADPDPRIVLVQHVGLVATGTTAKTARVSRDLYHRAIEVMAGAEALGRVRVARRRGELRDRVLAARALQARAGAAARRAAGAGRARHRRRRRHRPRDRRRA